MKHIPSALFPVLFLFTSTFSAASAQADEMSKQGNNATFAHPDGDVSVRQWRNQFSEAKPATLEALAGTTWTCSTRTSYDHFEAGVGPVEPFNLQFAAALNDGGLDLTVSQSGRSSKTRALVQGAEVGYRFKEGSGVMMRLQSNILHMETSADSLPPIAVSDHRLDPIAGNHVFALFYHQCTR